MERIYITKENREGQCIWFNKIDEGTYTIDTDSNYALKYARFLFQDVPDDACVFDFEHNGKKGIYTTFDPSGGPFMDVGFYKIEGKTLERIYFDNGTLTFKTKMD